MTPTIRRAHRLIWLSLLVLLPIGFVAALWVRTQFSEQNPPAGLPLETPLPVVIKSVEQPGLRVTLRQNEEASARQLEVLLRQPFELPSVVVRVGGANGPAIGQLDVAGVYRFALPNSTLHPTIVLTDDIHHTVLQMIHF